MTVRSVCGDYLLQDLKSTKILISLEMKIRSSFSTRCSTWSLQQTDETRSTSYFERNQDFG